METYLSFRHSYDSHSPHHQRSFYPMCHPIFYQFIMREDEVKWDKMRWDEAPDYLSIHHTIRWDEMRRHDMTWHDMTWHDMTWHDMIWHEMGWDGMRCVMRWEILKKYLLHGIYCRTSRCQISLLFFTSYVCFQLIWYECLLFSLHYCTML